MRERGREGGSASWITNNDMQSALSDGLLSISLTEWASEEARQRDWKGVKVKVGRTEKDKKDQRRK